MISQWILWSLTIEALLPVHRALYQIHFRHFIHSLQRFLCLLLTIGRFTLALIPTISTIDHHVFPFYSPLGLHKTSAFVPKLVTLHLFFVRNLFIWFCFTWSSMHSKRYCSVCRQVSIIRNRMPILLSVIINFGSIKTNHSIGLHIIPEFMKRKGIHAIIIRITRCSQWNEKKKWNSIKKSRSTGQHRVRSIKPNIHMTVYHFSRQNIGLSTR